MARHVRLIVAALALPMLASPAIVGQAAAQTTGVATQEIVEISPTQRTTIYRSVTREHLVPAAPRGWHATVGARVPQAVELHEFPQTIVTEVPVVKRYKYMVVNGEVVMVDPSTSEVVSVIHE